MSGKSHEFVMTTNVIEYIYHTGSKNMKTVKKESEKVWRCNRTKIFTGIKSPYVVVFSSWYGRSYSRCKV